MKNSYKRREQRCKIHGPVVQGVDNAIHQINHYPLDSIVCFVSTYPLDGDLSGGYKYGTSGHRRRRGEPGRVLVKRLREQLLVFHSKHQEIDFLVSRAVN